MSRLLVAGAKEAFPWHKLAKLLAFSLVVAGPAAAAAQATPTYQVYKRPQPFQLLGAGATNLGPLGDSGVATITLPFPVQYFGTTYNTIYANANQFASFTHSSTGSHWPDSFLGTGTPAALISVFWADATCDSSTSVRSQTLGTSPDRNFVIEWNCNEWGDTGAKVPAQIWFTEGSVSFEVRYGVATGSWDEGAMGIKSPTGQEVIIPVGARNVTCGITCNTADVPANMAIVYSREADLEVREVAVPSQAWGGVPLHIEATIANTGGKDATNFDVRFHLSADQILDAGDTILGTVPGPAILAPSQVATVIADLIVPPLTVPGDWYVLAQADPANVVLEGAEGNNVGASAAVEIGQPTPDLLVESIVIPPGSQTDGNVRFTWTATNRGAEQAVGVAYTIIASINDYISTSDENIGSGTFSIGALGSVDLEENVALPPDFRPGARYIGVIIDPENILFEPDETNNSGISDESVLLGTTRLAVTTTALPAGEIGGHYCQLLDAAGGVGSYVWSVESGMLPPGLGLLEERAGGDEEPPLATMLCGTPHELGTFDFSLRVSSGGLNAVRDYSVTITEPGMPLTVATYEVRTAVARDLYEDDLLAVGGTPPYAWSVVEGELPAGVVLLANGELRGAALADGTYSFRARVVDDDGAEDFVDLDLTVAPPNRITCMTSVLPSQAIGTEYAETLRVAGGTGTYTWKTVESRRLPMGADRGENHNNREPPGMTLASDGRVSGTPLKAGRYLWQVSVAGTGSAITDTCSITFDVTYDQGLTMTTTALGTAYAGSPYTAELEVSGGKGPYVWAVGPGSSLPQGLELKEDGVLTGKMPLSLLGGEKSKTFSFSVHVVDQENRNHVAPLSLTLRDEPVIYKAPAAPESSGCQAGMADPGLLALGTALGLAALRRRR